MFLAAIRQHGLDWGQVKAAMDEAGHTSRKRECFKARWRILEARAVKEQQTSQEAAAAASSSTFTLGVEKGSSLGGAGDKEGVLTDHGLKEKASPAVAAGPMAWASASLRIAQVKRGSSLPAVGISLARQSHNAAASRGRTTARSCPPQSRLITTPLAPEPFGTLEVPKFSSIEGKEEGTAPPPAMAAAAPTDTSAQPATTSTAGSYWPQSSPTLNYSIHFQPNGFLITNLPPNHQLRILTPTQCQVVIPAHLAGPAQLSHIKELPPPPQQQQQQSELLPEAEAPFVFAVQEDGTVEALNLPEGTTSTVNVMQSEAGEVRAQRCYASVDGYVVVFDNAMQ